MNHFKLAFGKNTHKIKQQKNKKEANNPPQAQRRFKCDRNSWACQITRISQTCMSKLAKFQEFKFRVGRNSERFQSYQNFRGMSK